MIDLLNKMTSDLTENTSKKLLELNKIIQNMNDQLSKELESMKSAKQKFRGEKTLLKVWAIEVINVQVDC